MMINLFDLSAGMASSKLLTDRAHRDASPVRKNRPDVKRTADRAKVHVHDKLEASDRGSSGNKSNATPIKMLLAKETTKEMESKRNSPSVVARLMGLEDDLPSQEPILHSTTKKDIKGSHPHNNLPTAAWSGRHHHHSSKAMPCDAHIPCNATVEYKDVYEVCEQSFHFRDRLLQKERFSENKSDRRMEVVRQKFMEAKRLATDEKLLHSKEFHEALEVLSSNRDLFLKFLEEPHSVFSKQLSGLHKIPAPPQTKRITVLKPVKSVESKAVSQTRRQQVNESGSGMRKPHQRSCSKEEIFSQPTRIVVLKPSPGKPRRTKAKLTPRANSAELFDQNDFYGSPRADEATLGSGEVPHRRDESLLSSVYSNGYGGDESSFSRSEIEYVEDGGSFSDSEVVSPVSCHSWDYVRRYGSPYSASSFSRASHSPESSVIREAKKRLSERWAMVAHNEVSPEQMQLLRSSSTLGEMLALQEEKKHEDAAGALSISSSRSHRMQNVSSMQGNFITTYRKDDGDTESSPRNLSRSKSVPVSSSTFDNIVVKAQGSNSQETWTMKAAEAARPNKGKSSLKGKFSSFFFFRSKKAVKEKTSPSSDSSNENDNTPFHGNSRSETNDDICPNQRSAVVEDKIDNGTLQRSTSPAKGVVSLEMSISSDCPSRNLDTLGADEGLKSARDQPSPTSVLDATYEHSNSYKRESSGSTSSCNQKLPSRSLAIESVARFLSWEEANLESPLLSPSKLPTFLSVADDDELEYCVLVKKIISSAGLDSSWSGMVFEGWYLPDCPLNPVLLDKFLDHKEEAAKSRERRSNQRLLFDCVNMALLEIGQNALLSAYPWGKVHVEAWRKPLSYALGVDLWSLVRNWLCGSGKLMASENENAGTLMERIVKRDVDGHGWAELMRSELDAITKEIEAGVLEELVGETLADFAFCLRQ